MEKRKIDPALREKLLKETKKPFAGPRRLAWVALFGSASLGLLIMLLRFTSGDSVSFQDFGIQSVAFLLFGTLVLRDRDR